MPEGFMEVKGVFPPSGEPSEDLQPGIKSLYVSAVIFWGRCQFTSSLVVSSPERIDLTNADFFVPYTQRLTVSDTVLSSRVHDRNGTTVCFSKDSI